MFLLFYSFIYPVGKLPHSLSEDGTIPKSINAKAFKEIKCD